MSEDKSSRPKARLPRGFRDRRGSEIAAERGFIDTIRRVYESYGFEPLETPAFEYTDALGKFLPDVDRRRYQVGSVWRNEKPGPGRFREFTQFDADTVGSASPAADAELLMMTCDTLEALGLKRGEYVVKMNSRKLLDGVLDAAEIHVSQRGTVLRAVDKFDRLGEHGVELLLGAGRKDESGDFTKGAGLEPAQIRQVLELLTGTGAGYRQAPAFHDLKAILDVLRSGGYDEDRVATDTSIIRGLD
jgi:histidyl-tRNA synthetase